MPLILVTITTKRVTNNRTFQVKVCQLCGDQIPAKSKHLCLKDILIHKWVSDEVNQIRYEIK